MWVRQKWGMWRRCSRVRWGGTFLGLSEGELVANQAYGQTFNGKTFGIAHMDGGVVGVGRVQDGPVGVQFEAFDGDLIVQPCHHDLPTAGLPGR